MRRLIQGCLLGAIAVLAWQWAAEIDVRLEDDLAEIWYLRERQDSQSKTLERVSDLSLGHYHVVTFPQSDLRVHTSTGVIASLPLAVVEPKP
ncbi:MAG: hypothetical protein ACYDCL_21410 [Myxococcales bacterium]